MLFHRLRSSTSIWLLALLLLAEVFYRCGYFNVRQIIDRAPLVSNIRRAVTDAKASADVIVVGSSLCYCFTYDLEHGCNPDAEPGATVSNCAADTFMSGMLTKLTNRLTTVDVMALPGAMAGEITNIVDVMLSSGKRPRVVLYLAAPRDFVDCTSPTNQPPIMGSAQETGRAGTAATTASETWIAAHLPPDVVQRMGLLITRPTVALACELALDCCSKIYQQRTQLRTELVNIVCNVFDRDADLWAAAHRMRSRAKSWTKFERDLGDYSQRYNPPNFQRLQAESGNLRKLVETCHAHGTGLVIVNMPLSAENKRLLDKRLYGQYKQQLASCSKDALVIDCDAWQTDFSRAEFLDSSHLNVDGSRKLQTRLAPRLASMLKS